MEICRGLRMFGTWNSEKRWMEIWDGRFMKCYAVMSCEMSAFHVGCPKIWCGSFWNAVCVLKMWAMGKDVTSSVRALTAEVRAYRQEAEDTAGVEFLAEPNVVMLLVLLLEEIQRQLIDSLSHYYRVLYIPGGAGFLPSTVSPPNACSTRIFMCQLSINQVHLTRQ